MPKVLTTVKAKTKEFGKEVKSKTAEIGKEVVSKTATKVTSATSELGDYFEHVRDSTELPEGWERIAHLVPSLDVGDIIEFDRGGGMYHHYAVYVGENVVVHLAGGFCDFVRIGSALKHKESVKKVEIREEDVIKVAGSSPCRKNNLKDDVLPSGSPEFIVSRARSMLGHSKGFSPLYDNDKHFALWCRFGIRFAKGKSDDSVACSANPWTKVDGFLDSLEVGDLVEFRRTVGGKRLLEHWAVFIGKETLSDDTTRYTVIHRTGTAGTFFAAKLHHSTQICVVEKADLVKEAGDDNCRVHNALDELQKPLEAHEIVERAKSLLGKSDYDVLKMNCEHFANWCRYGSAFSLQAERVLNIGVK